jgi:hypothetical protein
VPPSAAIWLRVASSASAPRAQIDTLAPDPAKASAIARPMPRLPPATIARLPPRSMFIVAHAPSSKPKNAHRDVAQLVTWLPANNALLGSENTRAKERIGCAAGSIG